jgi:hypothetical protein
VVSFSLMMAMTAALAATMGYMAARRRGDDDRGDEDHDDDEDERRTSGRRRTGARGAAAAPADPKAAFVGMPFALGDVVSSHVEERWLAGALVLREQGSVVAALLLAPEGRALTAVAAFPAPRREIFWMEPATVASPDEPPATIELRGGTMRRASRLPVEVERLGQGAPGSFTQALFAIYEGQVQDVAVVIVSQGQVHAWAGKRLDEGEYDRLGEG